MLIMACVFSLPGSPTQTSSQPEPDLSSNRPSPDPELSTHHTSHTLQSPLTLSLLLLPHSLTHTLAIFKQNNVSYVFLQYEVINHQSCNALTNHCASWLAALSHVIILDKGTQMK